MRLAIEEWMAWYPWTLVSATVTCALAPAYTVRWHIGFYPTTLLETAIVLTVLVYLVETYLGPRRIEWRTSFTYPAVLFLIAGVISVFAAPDQRAALGLFRAYLVEPIAFFFIVATIARNAERAILLGLGLAVGAVGLAIPNAYVVIEAIRHHTLHVEQQTPVAIYMTANAVAMFLEPLIALAASILVHSADRRYRVASLAFLVIAVPASVLTLSRGGLLALGAIGVGLALSHRRRWLLMGAGAIAGLATLLVPTVAARVAVEIDLSNPSNTLVGRSELWRVTLQMLRDHPIFGAGLAGFTERIGPYWNPAHADRFIDPHNILLNFWVETGVLGVVAFTWILMTAFRVSWRGWHMRHSPEINADASWHPIHVGVFLALVGIVVHGLVDVPYFKNDLSLEFWVLAGLTWAGVRWMGGAGPSHTPAASARPSSAS